ncbi:MAG: PKD domain-containing protein [Sphingobacteriaceae bacterium]|nr:PKD domain-containing protein [Cytophagaceae bacterium]
MLPRLLFLLLPVLLSCKKDTAAANRPPGGVELRSQLLSLNPFRYEFRATATDPDLDALTYTWTFGDGQTANGEIVSHNFADEGKTFTVTLTVSDGSATATASTTVSTQTSTVTIDPTQKFQTIEGFGGFGGNDVYWRPGQKTSPQFVKDVVDNLGLSIHREEIPMNFEAVNDNDDPNLTDLSRYNLTEQTAGDDGIAPVARHFEVMKSLKEAGVNRFIVSVWSPPRWMKWNNLAGNGTKDQNSAPAYTSSPTTSTNQLKPELYPEFAEMIVAYIRLLKRETGIDLHAISLQNEPRFSQFYQSCVYNGEALRDVIKTVGQRFKREGIMTKIFLPEDIGYTPAVSSLLLPTLNDAEARSYVGLVAVHGYAFDGVQPGSADASTWQTIFGWGQPHNLPLWMTETSGYDNDLGGAIKLANAIYIALRYGNASAWLFWTLSTQEIGKESLMSTAGQKSKRFFVSKQFYRYVRPGARRIGASSETANVLALAFQESGKTTLVLINQNSGDQVVRLTGISGKWSQLTTAANLDCAKIAEGQSSDRLLLPATSVSTVLLE